MNRLTSEEGQLYACGNALCSDGDIECANCRYANEAFLKLAEYENVGLQPERIDSIIEQLLGYLDAEQAGLLIEFPCKVGDKVYVNSRTFGTYDDIEYAEAEVVSIRITKKQTFVKLRIFALGLDGMPYGCSSYPVSSFGKTVFLTREEAEKALNKEE